MAASGGVHRVRTGDSLVRGSVVATTGASDCTGARGGSGVQQVTGGVKAVGADKRAHPTAGSQAQQAQNAAASRRVTTSPVRPRPPRSTRWTAQQAGSFDKKAFIAAVKAAIEAKSPKTLKEADDYAKSGKAEEVKGDVKGLVGQGKQGQAKDIETATAAEPDTSKAVAKPVTPHDAGQSRAPLRLFREAAPRPSPHLPSRSTSKQASSRRIRRWSDAQVSEEQLAQSNEPDFQKALSDKQDRGRPRRHRTG